MNSEKNKNLGFIILLLALMVLGFFLGKTGKKRQNNYQISEILNYKDTVMFYKSKSGELIAYNKSLNVSYNNLKKANDSLVRQIEDLKIKKPTNITTVKTEVVVKEVYIPYNTELPCDSFSIPFNFNDNWISIDGNSSNHGLRFDSIKLTNDMLIVSGVKRNGLFKPSETIVAVKSSNPYFNLIGLQNYTIVEEKRFYNKLWFKGLIFTGGVFTGIIISR
jgi:hypothetical protein